MVRFRKHLSADKLTDINGHIIRKAEALPEGKSR
jgi:hypothetical protein